MENHENLCFLPVFAAAGSEITFTKETNSCGASRKPLALSKPLGMVGDYCSTCNPECRQTIEALIVSFHQLSYLLPWPCVTPRDVSPFCPPIHTSCKVPTIHMASVLIHDMVMPPTPTKKKKKNFLFGHRTPPPNTPNPPILPSPPPLDRSLPSHSPHRLLPSSHRNPSLRRSGIRGFGCALSQDQLSEAKNAKRRRQKPSSQKPPQGLHQS